MWFQLPTAVKKLGLVASL